MTNELREHWNKLIDHATWTSAYEAGYRKPRYPVPAIRRHYEWLYQLHTGEILIVLCEQGTYPCD